MTPPNTVVNLTEDSQILNDSTKLATKIVCKFVIISNSEESVIIFGPVSDYPYHSNLVKHFCDMKDIPSGWVKKPDLYKIYDNSYTIKGGGWLEINVIKETIIFYGLSTAYGKYERTDVLVAISSYTNFSGYSIVFKE